MDAIEFRSQEGSEGREATESMEVRALDSATFEPSDYLEQTVDFKQSEAIQSSLEVVMANIPEDTVAGLRPQIVEGTFEKSPGKDDGGDDITPINLPGIQSTADGEIGFKYYPKEPGSVEIPLPGTAAEGVGITPINLPHEADLASNTGGVARSGAEGVGITPINLPREANLVSGSIGGDPGGSEVATGGLKGPGGDGVASGAVKGPGGDGVASGVFTGPGGDGVASAPVPQPVPDVADGSLEGLGALPDPIPHPEDEIGFKFVTKESGSVEIPLPGTAAEGVVKNEIGWKMDEGKGPAGEVETPLPGITGEGGLTEEAAIEQVVVRTEGVLQEMGVSFNLQYLILQNKISHENRQFSMPSNILKTDHDTAKNSINNIR